MALSAAEISRNIQAALKVLDPDISADPLTVERKIIDTVSEVLASGNVDQFVLNYQYDIDSKAGADLDKFVALFGFARQAGRQATGTVTLGVLSPAITDIFIASGTQVVKPATSVTPASTFQITAPGTLFAGSTEIDVSIEATLPGTIGNVAANTITSFGSASANGITTITNAVATSGGTDFETDAELRVRFKNTILRNVTGTRDQYLAIAISSQFANKANVLGPISRYIEYVQTGTSGLANSVIPYSKYTYNYDYYLTNGDLANEVFYSPRGVDYTFSNTVPPSIAVTNPATIPSGSVVLLEHSYCSANSRNDPANNIANYVDIYVSGRDETLATETALFPASSNNFVSSNFSPYYNASFARYLDGRTPTIGNRFQELIWQPVDILPDSISINNAVYYQNIDYWLVKDITTWRGSRRSRDGIEWSSSAAASITHTATFAMTYNFNRLPLTLNEVIDAHKQVTSDALVHAATIRYFNITFVIMYTPGFARAAVDQQIEIAISNFLEKEDFGAIIQMSDLVDIAHGVTGVDNVRLAQPSDGSTYGIQEVAPNGTTPIGGILTNDFTLQDSDLPVLNSIATIQRSQNTWS
jgi:uncharacterized phage protein gp47/JayE